jgi:glycosidase
MRRSALGLVLGCTTALLVGCGASVDGGSEVFVNEADLRASIQAPPGATPGTNAEWRFVIDNSGPQPVTAVPVTGLLELAAPAGAGLLGEDAFSWTCVATNGSCGDASGRGPIETSVSLASGGQATLRVRAPVSFKAMAGAGITASVEVAPDARWPDPNTANNLATSSTAVAAAPPLADFADEIIYWAMTDRFSNGDPANDNGLGDRRGDGVDPANPIGWQGGDFAGIQQKIEEGYFQGMGFTAIWISPVVLQVPALSNGNAAYHGYWPEDWALIEPHFGTLADLSAMTAAAQAAGLKIIMDVVVNHVGFDAALIPARPDWVRTGSECGTDDETLCLAGLPDLVQENPEVEAFLLETVASLLSTTGVDAIRWDAMKHVNRDFWTAVFAPGAAADRGEVWSVGEVFSNSPEQIAFYLDSVGSPSLFDFPLADALRTSLTGLGFTARIADVLAADGVYSDPGRLTTFIDNHDIRRWISVAIEDGGKPRGEALERLDMALSFLYANRGIPSVYYGTEIGMEGLGDPFSFRDGNSNREPMDFAAAGDPALTNCIIEDQGLDNAAAFGAEFFVRGGFNDWGTPTRPESKLINLGDGQYAAAFEVGSGNYEFKVAAEDWSAERTADVTVALDTPVALSPSGGNVRFNPAQDGCYRFGLDVSSSTETPTLTVSRLNTAAPLVRRLAALASARQEYPALRRGTQDVLYDFGQQCRIGEGAPPDPFGGQLFMRGGFNDWGANPEAGFIRTGETAYEAEFQVAAGEYGYKVALADWSYERAVLGEDTAPGAGPQPLVDPGPGGPNGNLAIPAAGCYNFRIDAADLAALTLEVTAGTGDTCGVQPADPDEIAFGRRMFVRGSFSDWADPPAASDAFASTGVNRLEALVALPAGEHVYKIASADWSVERAVIGVPTLLDTSQLIGIPAGNGSIAISNPGCYRWTLDTADPEVAMLVVSAEPASGDVFAMRRDLDGAASVLLVLNNGDAAADLAALGGIEAAGFTDGAAIELTDRPHGLSFAGGRLIGTVPPRTAYIVSDR